MDKNLLLQHDSQDAQKMFNINKYYEFAYKTKQKDLEDKDLRNVE